MAANNDSIDARLIERVLGEYREMPGLALTIEQARRLWGCDAATCPVSTRYVSQAIVPSGLTRCERLSSKRRRHPSPKWGWNLNSTNGISPCVTCSRPRPILSFGVRDIRTPPFSVAHPRSSQCFRAEVRRPMSSTPGARRDDLL